MFGIDTSPAFANGRGPEHLPSQRDPEAAATARRSQAAWGSWIRAPATSTTRSSASSRPKPKTRSTASTCGQSSATAFVGFLRRRGHTWPHSDARSSRVLANACHCGHAVAEKPSAQAPEPDRRRSAPATRRGRPALAPAGRSTLVRAGPVPEQAGDAPVLNLCVERSQMQDRRRRSVGATRRPGGSTTT